MSSRSLPTMRDVATRAGVSPATVSRVLNAGYVSSSAKERVLAAIDDLGYRPNRLARNMRLGSARVLSLVVSDITNPFFTGLARGAEDIAQSNGYSLAVFNTDEDPVREAACLQVAVAERSAGVMLASTGQARDALSHVLDLGMPLVAIDRRIEGVDSDLVAVDNVSAAHEAVLHLLDFGHRRIAIVGGPEGVSTANERLDGYCRALRERGVPVDETLICHANFREDGGWASTIALMSLADPPTAIFSANNLMTIGVLRALRSRQVAIAHAMSVISFDDLPVGDLLDPPLSVIQQPIRKIGEKAAQLLLRRIGEPNSANRHLILSARLLVRGSTGPPTQALSGGSS